MAGYYAVLAVLLFGLVYSENLSKCLRHYQTDLERLEQFVCNISPLLAYIYKFENSVDPDHLASQTMHHFQNRMYPGSAW